MDNKKKTTENSYVLAPEYKNKFNPRDVQSVMRAVMQEKIQDKPIQKETGSNVNTHVDQSIPKIIADEIRDKLKEMEHLKRYKFIVNVIMGDQKGQGVRMGTRCFWDPTCDAYATETFRTENVFCVATAYGVYHY